MNELGDVCAGIVLYNPNIERLEKVVNSIKNQVQELIMVNNGSENVNKFLQIIEKDSTVTYINNEENEGIAKALNQMCRYAIENKYKWIFTLDQDTVCPPQIVEKLLAASDFNKLGIVCPAVFYDGLGWNTQKENVRSEYVYACMTSASLTNLKAWKEVNGFEDDYFIDYVDNEFCMKLWIAGYKILHLNNCCINHQLGDFSEITLLGMKFHGSSHNPIRCYYRMRNNVLFLKKYHNNLSIVNLNIYKEYAKVAYIFCGEFFFSKTKKKTIKYMLRGLRDGFKGVTGQYKG